MTVATAGTTRELASFLSALRFEDLPDEVVERIKEFFLDWVASALAGKDARPVQMLEHFADTVGPDGGPSEILVSRQRTSSLFTALVNGATSHVGSACGTSIGSRTPAICCRRGRKSGRDSSASGHRING